MFIEIILTLFIGYWTYLFFKVWSARRKLKWLPSAPRIPILGSVFEFGDSTRILQDMSRLTDNPSKTFYMEILHNWFLTTRDYDLVEFILSSNTILDKDASYDYVHPWLGTGLLTSTGQKWRKHRRVITPAFHFSILEQFIDVFESNGKFMIEKLYKEALDEEVNIYTYVTACALDIISETAMGVSVDSQNNKNGEYVNAVKDMLRILMVRAFSSWKSIDFLYQFTEDYRKQKKHLEILHGFTNSVIDRRIEELKKKTAGSAAESTDELGRKRKLAFLDLLLSATVDGKPLSREDIREEVDTFMFEGHDTTSTAITLILYLLTNHPDVQAKVREEQKQIFGNDRDRPTTYQDLQDMKYLDMVVKEGIRLYPSVPGIGRCFVKDTEYKGHVIPAGTRCTIYIYGINRDPDYYESPNEFIPERFLDMNSKKPFAYIPFSAGPRNCIGQKFAMLEMKSMVSKIIRNFELHQTSPPHEIILSNEAVLKSNNGVRVILKKHQW